MLITIAWRNIWRNPVRSFVVIGAIGLGIWAAISMTGFATGMINSYVSNAIQNFTAHIQLHDPGFREEYDVKKYISQPEAVRRKIVEQAGVKEAAIRTAVNGMVSTAEGARGIRILGVQPEREQRVSKVAQKMVEGSFFEEDRGNQLLLSTDMAEKLDVGLRKKVVLTFQNLNGDITAGAFRIAGLFDTGDNRFDQGHLLVQRSDLNRLLLDNGGIDSIDIAHEIALLLNDPSLLEQTKASLQEIFPTLKVETYREISPDLELYESQISFVSMIYLVIIMLALVFGIINTMLMAVLERIKELGMLMAIGMNKVRVFFMIILETIMLGLAGVPVGLLLGGLTIAYFGRHGIDFSVYSEALQNYGISEVVYFAVDNAVYFQAAAAVTVTALVASIYPAVKAIQLRPVEALHKI